MDATNENPLQDGTTGTGNKHFANAIDQSIVLPDSIVVTHGTGGTGGVDNNSLPDIATADGSNTGDASDEGHGNGGANGADHAADMHILASSKPMAKPMTGIPEECLKVAQTILVLGCSHGGAVEWLWQHGHVASGMDVAAVVAKARQTRHPASGSCMLECFRPGKATAIPWPDRSFDAILSTEVLNLEQIKASLPKVVREFRRVVRRTGYLFLKIGFGGQKHATQKAMRKPDWWRDQVEQFEKNGFRLMHANVFDHEVGAECIFGPRKSGECMTTEHPGWKSFTSVAYDYATAYEEWYRSGYHSDLNLSHGIKVLRGMPQECLKMARTILDVGCSHGAAVEWLWQHGYVASGMDVAQTAVDKAKGARHPQGGASVNCISECFRQGSATAIPWPDHSVDAIFSTEMLEHIDEADVPKVVAEFRRVVRLSGFLFLQVNLAGEEDEKHRTVKSAAWWRERFKQRGFKLMGETLKVHGASFMFGPSTDPCVSGTRSSASASGNSLGPHMTSR
eukprot:gnl/MRDRNA2_/MRDRNA2_205805_c0_seq1.p1 gnl/MRDRNA2_/MRDRNA2_205805_c0~~gnl/MRDRNA2_/MRDRNA2_205805_c0_seq1.p1  ORF type:complete len:509 (-),score=99.43 gnl/MRDRNA2_/MRDRNA2_205805_c0_seq1:467-1993(-)